MTAGEFTLDRFLPKAVKAACDKRAINYESFSDEWVLKLQKDNKLAWVCGYKFDCNGSAASAVANDKVAASLALSALKIPVVPHILARSVPQQTVNESLLSSAFLANQALVIKPLTGSGGKGVELANSVAEAVYKIKASNEPAWAVSPYINIAQEFRFIILNGNILLSYEKQNPVKREGLTFFNLGLGATPRLIGANNYEELSTLACQAVSSLNLSLAAVDICVDLSGKSKVMEVNDGIMAENFARHSKEYEEHAYELYDKIIESLFE